MMPGRRRSRWKGERGQVIGFFVVAMVVLIATAGFAIDVGSWYRADRQAQTVADAAALAGAQALPGDVTTAQALADQYANLNGGTEAVKTVTISSTFEPNDTITVEITDQTPGFFTKLFGRSVVDVHARATARVGVAGAIENAAPFVVNMHHEMLLCGSPAPCGGSVVLPYNKDETDAPGAFGLLDFENDANGTVGSSTLASWILWGYDSYLGSGVDYYSDPGAKFSSNNVQAALDARIASRDPMWLPVYDPARSLVAGGSNAEYFVIGWVGFVITGYDIQGNEATLYGYFTGGYAEGIQSGSGTPNFGVYDIQLVE